MKNLKLTLVQANLHWEDKTANLQQLEQHIAAIETPTHVVVLPELFSTGFSMAPERLAESMEGTTVEWMRRIAAKKRVILTGSVIISEPDAASSNTHYYNRLIWMLPNGQYGTYDKRHRFAYAGEDQHYTAGHKRLVTSVNGWRLNLQVCYDLRFPVWARQASAAAPEYDALVYVANWPQRRIHAWRTLLQARAIENQCYVVGVNRVGADGNGIEHSGNSMLVDPLGEILYEAVDTATVHTVTLSSERLQELRQQLPFLRDGDAFTIHDGA